MNPELDRLIDLFLDAVRLAVAKLVNGGIRMPTSNVDWSWRAVPQTGTLPCGAQYFRHGFGVEVTTDTLSVDFDFGERGETDGFDAWRLYIFADQNGLDVPLQEEEDYRVLLDQALAAGALVKRGDLYYRAEPDRQRRARLDN